MKDLQPFDHRPDPVLGDALRRALDQGGGDAAGFVARVLARAEAVGARPASWDAVLARWARVGVAAAIVVAAASGYLVGRATATAPPLARRPSVTEALIAPPGGGPEVEIVLASVIGN